MARGRNGISRDEKEAKQPEPKTELQLGHPFLNFSLHIHRPPPTHTVLEMFRSALIRSARSATAQVVRRQGAIVRPAAPSSFVTKAQFAPSAFQAARCYSASAGLQKPEVEGRIVDLLKNFDKVRSRLFRWNFSANITVQVTDASKVRQSLPFLFSYHN